MLNRLVAILLIAVGSCAARADDIDFVRDVRPIFDKHCIKCHTAEKQESGLRLDVKELALKGGDNQGPDILPGKADESPLLQLIISSDKQERMPPEGAGLTSAEVETIKRWLDQGAIWPEGVDRVQLKDLRDHWSFKPLVLAAGKDSIDAFIDDRLEQVGLRRSPPASPIDWLRRISFDLIGLPPTTQEVDDFLRSLAESSGQPQQQEIAYQQVVDRLLSSPRYGERWAQHWLDVVRYADTHGFEVNTERPNAWPYRDYCIDAFNDDVPYDQFIREQIAGDALGSDAATGFLITASVLLPGQIGKDAPSIRLARQDALDEIVNNISQTFLALSVGCARCHDHKFDPITSHDYYAMQAFVAGVEYEDRELRTRESESAKLQATALRGQLEQLDKQLLQLIQAARPGSQLKATNARENSETFTPRAARYVRFTIDDANLHPDLGLIEPCIDEFEIYSHGAEPKNVALSSLGTRATASGSRESDSHKLVHVNDGQLGNSRSWMSDVAGRGWLLFELPAVVEIDRVVWSRDRLGQFTDRLPTAYRLEVGLDTDQMQTVVEVVANGPGSFSLAGLAPPEAQTATRLLEQKRTIESQLKPLETRQLAFAGKFREPDEIHLLNRGDPEQPGVVVLPEFPSVFSDRVKLIDVVKSIGPSEQARRVALAEWIARADNPLTARVMVNRVWQGHFGKGLVETSSDFGHSGTAPTHPELLDWLTSHFIQSGWSIKQLHRLIVLSGTYRQSSRIIEGDGLKIDAEVRTLWRYPSRRLDAEVLRDAMLAISGQLNLKMHGSGFDLFDKRGGLTGFKPIESYRGEGLRRMIYAHKVRREREAVFGAFDCPDAGQSTARRRESTTPLQSLNLFNSTFTLEQASAMARRIEMMTDDNIPNQIRHAYRLALSREPHPDEFSAAQPVVQLHGLQPLCRALLNCNEGIFIP